MPLTHKKPGYRIRASRKAAVYLIASTKLLMNTALSIMPS